MNKKILVLSVLFLFLIMGCGAKHQTAIGVMDPQYWKTQAINGHNSFLGKKPLMKTTAVFILT